MDGQFRLRIIRRVVALQPRDDVAVDFHHVQMIQSFQQWAGQRTEAWPDFHHMVFRFRTDRSNDASDDLLIDEEILAKMLFGLMTHMNIPKSISVEAHARSA